MRLRRALSVAVIVVTVGAAVAPRGAEAARQPFLWGAATSSYQVEGGITNNDYDFFNRSPIVQDTVRTNSRAVGPSVELSPAGEAVRAWQPRYYRRDFDNARLLGLNSVRISLEWARLEPADDRWNEGAFAAYGRMLDAMRARGLRPVLTLNLSVDQSAALSTELRGFHLQMG
jgi:beta-glucosidase